MPLTSPLASGKMGNTCSSASDECSSSDDIVIYSIVGSQFVAKVITALDALGLAYRLVEVQPSRLKQDLVFFFFTRQLYLYSPKLSQLYQK